MFRPFGNRVLVRPDAAIDHASNVGIVIAPRDGRIVESQEQFGRRGTVVSVGPGKLTKKGAMLPMTVQPGDIVYFGEFQNTEIDLEGEKHFVISEMDITAVEEKPLRIVRQYKLDADDGCGLPQELWGELANASDQEQVRESL